MNIATNVNLLPLNTLALPGRAEFFCRVSSNDELSEALAYARDRGLSVTVLGGGSNVIVGEAVAGLVIQMATRGIDKGPGPAGTQDILWTAAAGENWHQFVLHTLANNSYGLENLSLIPGLVGAAPIQNIGAYGLELSERFTRLEALEISSGKSLTFSKSDCQFGYRDSVFKQSAAGRFVITSVTLALSEQPNVDVSYPALASALGLKQGQQSAISLRKIIAQQIRPQQVSEAVCRVRRQKLPDPAVQPNAGSFFKNPLVSEQHWQRLRQIYSQLPAYPQPDGGMKLPAAWLIEQAGWKGVSRGACGVHREHSLVLINLGACRGKELLLLAAEIIADIKQRFDVDLVIEPQLIGN